MLYTPLLLALVTFVLADLNSIQPEEGSLSADSEAIRPVPISPTAGLTWDSDICDRPNEYFFVDLLTTTLAHAGPVIWNDHGHEVWRGSGHASTYNFQTQDYKGQQVLTWWDGLDQSRGHGEGFYYMLDNNYRMLKNVTAIGKDYMGDYHEFHITQDDTALITIYNTIPFDLGAWGIEEGYIQDCLFQEIELETNQLLFEWRASEHVRLEDCHTNPSGHEGRTEVDAWDWYHISSVDKDEAGNYLVASQHAHGLFYVDGRDGSVLWTLGGKNTNFTGLSGGKVNNMRQPHHARFAGSSNSIHTVGNSMAGMRYVTVFDDTGEGHTPSRGLKVLMNEMDMTVSLVAEAVHPLDHVSAVEGSIQQLENSNLLISWGGASTVTEYSADGTEILCDMQFGPSLTANVTFGRAFRLPWHGFPLEPPTIFVDMKTEQMRVSWNGATELGKWLLDGIESQEDSAGASVVDIAEVEKQGFESSIPFSSKPWHSLRLTALTRNGQPLGSWILRPSGAIFETVMSPITSAANLAPFDRAANHPASLRVEKDNKMIMQQFTATSHALKDAMWAISVRSYQDYVIYILVIAFCALRAVKLRRGSQHKNMHSLKHYWASLRDRMQTRRAKSGGHVMSRIDDMLEEEKAMRSANHDDEKHELN